VTALADAGKVLLILAAGTAAILADRCPATGPGRIGGGGWRVSCRLIMPSSRSAASGWPAVVR
jgi:hypothetical protein